MMHKGIANMSKNKGSKGKGKLSADVVAAVIEAVASTVTGVVTVETPMDSNTDAAMVPMAIELPTDAPMLDNVAPVTIDAPAMVATTIPTDAPTSNTATDAVATPAQKAMHAIASAPVTLPVDGTDVEAPVAIANKRAMAMACVLVACEYYGCKPSDNKGNAVQLASKLFVAAGGGYCASKGRALIGEITVQGAKGYIAGYAMHAWVSGKNTDAAKRHKPHGDKAHETNAHMAMVKAAGRKYAALLGIDGTKFATTKA